LATKPPNAVWPESLSGSGSGTRSTPARCPRGRCARGGVRGAARFGLRRRGSADPIGERRPR
jgi:hypothetical protein